MHCKSAAAQHGMSIEDMYKISKGPEATEEGKKWRSAAKAATFCLQYGGGVGAMAQQSGMTIEQAKVFKEAYENLYPGATAYKAKVEESVKKHIKLDGGTKRHPFHPTQTYATGYGYFRGPTGRTWAFPLSPAPDFLVEQGTVASVSPTQIKNFPFQGTGCDWMKGALCLAFLLTCKGKTGNILFVGTVHDALYADAPAGEVRKASILLDCLMRASNRVVEGLGGPEIQVDVPCETGAGPSWGEEEVIPAAELDKPKVLQYITGLVPEVFH